MAAPAPGCPKFGPATVLNRPPDHDEEVSVRPGLHSPKAGTHQVVWFDPAVLSLRVTQSDGVENEQVLNGNAEQGEEGLRRYRQWQERRAARIAEGGVPSYRTMTAEAMAPGAGASITVETITLPAPAGRPGGRKFGRLVHDLLQHALPGDKLEPLAELWGRSHGTGELERAAAVETVFAALANPALAIPSGARVYRELPVLRPPGRRHAYGGTAGSISLRWTDGASSRTS